MNKDILKSLNKFRKEATSVGSSYYFLAGKGTKKGDVGYVFTEEDLDLLQIVLKSNTTDDIVTAIKDVAKEIKDSRLSRE